MTTPQATEAAKNLGYERTYQYPFESHGQPVYSNGKQYISPDFNGHNGGIWKIFGIKGNRLGTADADLNVFKG
ncbi:toxin C-terminal domain-containing protein [Rhodospirillum sp. A1_3_36]|uniref:toxin C-terminal domain-containing protein n=1 Tax=Rhodospirillum sp. A1_3_36 TaxID=3391666 RepID=UPI0039A75269